MTKGKIIVIEGTDCSFKETNSKRLYEYIKENITEKVKLFSFPNYERQSSYFVKKYLSGSYGNPVLQNPYTASICFAVDRLDWLYSYDIMNLYNEGYILIIDRYVGSNIIHQCCKLNSVSEMEEYIQWLQKLEYEHNKIPKEDICITLGLNYKYHHIILSNRENKSVENDGHEKDNEYQRKLCDEIVPYISNYMNWEYIDCYNNSEDRIKTKNEIFDEILGKINFD